jgi:hypothetical protein
MQWLRLHTYPKLLAHQCGAHIRCLNHFISSGWAYGTIGNPLPPPVRNGDCHPPAWEVRPPNPNPCWTWGKGQRPRRLTEPRSQSKKNPPRTKLLKAHPRPQSTFAGAEAQNPQSMGVSVPQPELPLDKGQRMRELEVRRPSVPRSPGQGEALIVALFAVMQSRLGEFKRSVFTRPRGVFMAVVKRRKPRSSRTSSLTLVPTS